MMVPRLFCCLTFTIVSSKDCSKKRVFQIPLQEEIPERGIYMIYKARKEENQARKKFLDMLNFSQKYSGKI